MATAKKCNTCKIRKEIEKSTEPACCMWYMDNVVLGDKNVNDCEIYQEDTEKQKGVFIISEFFDMDEYRQQLTDEICALIESFKLSGFNEEQALKLTEVYCRQGVNLVLLDLTRMKNVEKENDLRNSV